MPVPCNIRTASGTLTFAVGSLSVSLAECVVWATHSDPGDPMRKPLAASMPMHPKTAPLYSGESAVCSDEAGKCRIDTRLFYEDHGDLGGAVAHTELYADADGSAVLKLWFTADSYVPIHRVQLTATVTDANGESLAKQLGSRTAIHDLRDYDEAHAYCWRFTPTAIEQLMCRGKAPAGDGPQIVSGDLRVQLLRQPDGLSLAGIYDARAGALFESGATEPLFRVMIRRLDTGVEEHLTSEHGWDRVSVEESLRGPVFRFETADMTVQLSAVVEAAASRIVWELDVRLYSRALTVIWAEPPAPCSHVSPDTKLFMSYQCGRAIPVGSRGDFAEVSPYASIGVCMQFMAAYGEESRRGLYCGHHDPTGSVKFHMGSAHNGVLKMEAVVFAQGIGEAANGMHLEGSTVWQLFDGDWYDATLIYRDFVHTQASWFRGFMAKDRKDVPNWLLTMPVWVRASVGGNNWLEDLLEMRRDIGMDIPFGLHIYHWHQIPFDTNYPHYDPAKDEFVYQLPVLQAHDIKVMPYINGRLWDTHDRGDYDYQFTRLAKPASTKDYDGVTPSTEHYQARNSKGELVQDAAMCPSTALWQEKVQEITNWILNDLGCDAVYIDQIAAAPPNICHDRTHVHRPGGGSWWFEHYANLIDHCNQIAGPDKCFTTESNAEPFVGRIGGMLSWAWSQPDQVPAFPVLYAGYQPMLGRNYGDFPPNDHAAFRIMTGQSLCYGDQMGWLQPHEYLNSPYRAFFKQLVRLRWQYTEYFHSGRCLRPPLLEGDVGTLACAKFSSPGVLSALWQRFADGGRIAVLVNLTDEARTVTVRPEGEQPFEVSLAPVSAVIREL